MTEPAVRTDSSSRTTWPDRALTVAAVLGTLCILATVLSLSVGIRPVLFETGSMAPTIPTGSLGLAKNVPATSVQSGDVVGVVRSDGVRVTHRVESIDAVTGNSVAMTLKGDANARPDPEPTVVTEVTRVYGTVPLLGYVAAWLKNPYTLALQTMGLLALLAIAFAPKQGWRNSPTAQRLITGTSAVTVIALAASGTQGPGDAQAALIGQATAAGSVQAGFPNNPTSLTCVNTTTTIILLPYATVELRWPNPPANAGYTYELSFPGQSQAPITLAASSQGDPAIYRFQGGILQNLLTWILGGGTYQVRLTNMVGQFRSPGTLTQNLRATTPIIEVPAGIRCVTPGTVTGPAALRAPAESSPESAGPDGSADPSEPADPADPSKTGEPSESSSNAPEPSKDDTPTLPPGGTPSESGAYAWFRNGERVIIRDAENTEIEYEASYPVGSLVAWEPGTDDLTITAPDGTVTTVSKIGDLWRSTVTPPPAPQPTPGTPAPDPTVPVAPTPPTTQQRPATTAPPAPAAPPTADEPADS